MRDIRKLVIPEVWHRYVANPAAPSGLCCLRIIKGCKGSDVNDWHTILDYVAGLTDDHHALRRGDSCGSVRRDSEYLT